MLTKAIYVSVIALPRFFSRIGWWKWRAEGLENLPPRNIGGMLMVMNHVHWIDIIAVAALLPLSYRLSWLGKAELFEHPLKNWFFRTVEVIPIQRGQRDETALSASEQALRKGAALLVFPEGHRSRTGILQRGLGGTVRLAIRNNVPIVPLALIGSQDGVARSFQAKEILLRVGTPYQIDTPPDAKLSPRLVNRLTTNMMQRIAAMLPEDLRGYYRSVEEEGENHP